MKLYLIKVGNRIGTVASDLQSNGVLANYVISIRIIKTISLI